MTRRRYACGVPVPGRKGRLALEIVQAGDAGGEETAILALPAATLPAVTADILAALRRAYQDGREDRSAELIPAGRPGRLRAIVHAQALDAVGQWGTGYTDADEHDDGHQYYLALESRDEASGVLTMGIRDERHGGDLERFRVTVLVEKIEGQ